MNKKLIITYFEEFKYWLNGGKILSKYTLLAEWSDTQSEDIWRVPDGGRSKVLIVIDDEYVEFRKALAEGKTVEYLDFRDEWRNLKENCRKLEGVDLSRLRVKPDVPKFKVGDWVIHNGVYKQVTKVVDGLIDCLDNQVAVIMKDESLELWKPKEGEWCWVFNKLREVPVLRRVIKVEDNFKNRYDDEKYAKAVRVSRGDALSDEVGYRFCEPFTGKLPTYILGINKQH